MTMIGKYKWLLIPPAAALILFLGPLRQGGRVPDPPGQDLAAARDEAPAGRSGKVAMPDLWQLGSALLLVLVVGGGGIVLLARMRQAGGAAGGAVITLRQTLRLASRQHLHAVEFDGRLLLLGEVEGKLTLLQQGGPQADEDAALAAAGEEDGAVPRNLLIPRPASGAPAQGSRRPRAPRTTTGRPSQAELQDFRSLLRKVRASRG